MTLYKTNKEKRDLIMSYYLNPKYKNDNLIVNNNSIYFHSTACVDEINLNYDLESNFFEYKAQGCIIFLSSIEIFIEKILELGIKKMNALINAYIKLINQKELNTKEKSMLGKLNVYENVKTHLNRLECASIVAKVFSSIDNKK